MTNKFENGTDETVLFRCRHVRLDAIIAWLINGTLSRLYPGVKDNFIQESDGTFVDTLTILATPQYNGTEVVCLASFIDGSAEERSPPVTLIIITGELLIITVWIILIVHSLTTEATCMLLLSFVSTY